MTQEITIITQEVVPVTDDNQQFIELWLNNKRSKGTQKYYRSDAGEFLVFVGNKPIPAITFYDVKDYQQSLAHYQDGMRARKINVVKSLLTFAASIGLTRVNAGTAVKAPKVKNSLAQRIMTEEQVIKLVALETNSRNHAILRLLYHAGLRVSEIVNLKWDDVIVRKGGAQLSVWGKGEKLRQILISQSMYNELLSLPNQGGSLFVFQSRESKGGTLPMDIRQVERIVKNAAKRAGVSAGVSPHWLRHAHASHSLDRGTSIAVVRDTMGHDSLATTSKYTHARPNESSSLNLPL